MAMNMANKSAIPVPIQKIIKEPKSYRNELEDIKQRLLKIERRELDTMIGNLLVAFAKKALARTSRKKGSSGRTVLAAEIPKDNEEWGLPKSYHDIMTQNFCWWVKNRHPRAHETQYEKAEMAELFLSEDWKMSHG